MVSAGEGTWEDVLFGGLETAAIGITLVGSFS
jgi:hypothetical protein